MAGGPRAPLAPPWLCHWGRKAKFVLTPNVTSIIKPIQKVNIIFHKLF